ncbi:unnamed protein product [Symbiodinium sp. CCMP2592]|nr:unnamed protein product [Symbiodinium sp. CCMP2592]
MLPVRELTARYAHLCPLGLHTAFSGVDPVTVQEEAFFDLRDGICITVDFVFIDHPDDSVSSPALSSASTSDNESSEGDTSSDRSSGPSSEPRSRSPRNDPTPALGGLTHHVGGGNNGPALSECVEAAGRAHAGPYVQAVCASPDCAIPGLPALLSLRADAEDLLSQAVPPMPPRLTTKLLVEPPVGGGFPTDALPHLRDLARAIGLPWRYADASSVDERLLLAPPMPADEEVDFPVVLPLSFAILTPGYTQESLSVSAHIPSEEDYVLQLLQAERDPHRQRWFPILVPALPQPSDRWGLVLALPLWDPQASVVIIDARSHDGRLFAVQCPIFVSRHTVLWLAGIPDASQVHVWDYFEAEPLHDHSECRIFPGQIYDCALFGHICRAVLAVGWQHRETTGYLDFARTESQLGKSLPLNFGRSIPPWSSRPGYHNGRSHQPYRYAVLNSMCGCAGNAQDALRLGACGPTSVDLTPATHRSPDPLSDGIVCAADLGGRGRRRPVVAVLSPCVKLAAFVVSLCVQTGTAVQLPGHLPARALPALLQSQESATHLSPLASTCSAEGAHSGPRSARPIPTPCRAAFAVPVHHRVLPHPAADVAGLPISLGAHVEEDPVSQLELGPLYTLLWESSCAPDCQAFMLAATLLEACCEHFRTNEAAAPRRRISLCTALPSHDDGKTKHWDFWEHLDEALPRYPWSPADLPDLLLQPEHEQLNLGPYRFPCTRGQLLHFLQPVCHFGDGWDLAFAISQRDLQACRELRFRPSDFLSDELHCFTDGSFDTSAPDPEDTCAWACLFISPVSGFCAALSGKVPAWAFPEDKPSAFLAECFALIAAAWLSVTNFHHLAIVLRSDCLSALGIFQGTYVGAPTGAAAVLRSLGFFCREFSPRGVLASHVRGHQGCLGNELADCLARGAAKGRPCGHLAWAVDGNRPWWYQGGPPLSWAAVAIARLSGNAAYPPSAVTELPPCRDSLGLEPVQLVAPFLPASAPPAGEGAGCWGSFSLRVCSFNVLSLNSRPVEGAIAEGLAFQAARPTLLANCLKDAGVHVALLQEARTEEGTLRTQGYLRYASGGTNGTLGVEVWLLDGHPLFTPGEGKRRLRLAAEACIVVHRDPRRLLVLFRQEGFSLLIASVHAPHRACEATVISDWWAETHRLCNTHAHSAPILLGGDMNASVGSVLSAAVGDHAADAQDDSGALFASFLCSQQLWLPCTFSCCHSGPSGTYIQKRNGALTRIDFVACPTVWQNGRVRTWTDSTLHAGQAYVDHIATCCQIDLSINLRGPTRSVRQRRFDGRAMLTPQGRAAVERVFQHAPLIPWDASPHAHAATLVKYLQDALSTAFPPCQRRRHRSYLTDDTWALHAEVARLRKACTRVKSALRFHFLAAAFQAWACADGRILLRMLDSAWTREAHVAGALYSSHLGVVSGRLKSACKQDRAAHFSGLADEVQRDDPHANKAIQRLMGLRRRKPFRPDVLPMLQKEDGSFCRTPDEIVLRWREHFRHQEDGVNVRPEDLPSLPASTSGFAGPPLLSEMPSPDVLLQVIASSCKGKAAGPDGLPAEIGHAAPLSLARLLMPLLLKVGLTCEEPIGFKGGTLSKLYKGKGETSQCASYRAIMLLPTLAKFLHKAFRPGLYEVFSSNAAPAQLGGLKRTSVVLGSHLTRAFQRFCANAGTTSIVLFADDASAYYSAVRALTARKQGSGRSEHSSCPAGREHLEEALQQPTAMTQARASPWIETLTAELNSNTWMCLAGDSQPIATRQGSRPGSSFADLFFGVTIPRMLHWRDSARPEADAHGRHFEHAPVVHWDGRFDLSPPTTDPSQWCAATVLSDVVWADDLAKCIIVPAAKDAAFAAASECGLLADAFYAHGYDLSFGPAKTAAIVVPRGAGSRHVRKTLFGAKPILQVMREEQGAASLPLVTSYRHLGVKVTSANSLMTELRHRASHAWAAFQQGRTKVFRTGRIALRRRGLLLSTHVMTKLLFAAGAWPALSKGEHAFFFRTVMALYRQTLAIPHGGDQHLTHATICALIGQPPPEILLLTERARYLLQLVNAAPTQLWALIRRDPPYIAHLREAIFWVYRWVSATSNLRDPDSAWPEWEHLMRQRPHMFRVFAKRARGLEIARTSCIAALQAVRRSLEQLAGCDPAPTAVALQYPDACLQCKIAFPSRTAWACHASRLHGYRAPSTLLVAGCDKPLCRACGKLYANVGRLKRHLGASAKCRRGWGTFRPASAPTPNAHPEAPPLHTPGDWGFVELDLDPACAHPGLLAVLQGLDSPAQEQVWSAVVEYIEPLDVLRNTLDAWQQAPGPLQDPDTVSAISADVRLLLDPELWCEDFRAPALPLVVSWEGPGGLDEGYGTSFAVNGETTLLEHVLKCVEQASVDRRFGAVAEEVVQDMKAKVSLLQNFTDISETPQDWSPGTHGLWYADDQKAKVVYLPQVAQEVVDNTSSQNAAQRLVAIVRRRTGSAAEGDEVDEEEEEEEELLTLPEGHSLYRFETVQGECPISTLPLLQTRTPDYLDGALVHDQDDPGDSRRDRWHRGGPLGLDAHRRCHGEGAAEHAQCWTSRARKRPYAASRRLAMQMRLRLTFEEVTAEIMKDQESLNH